MTNGAEWAQSDVWTFTTREYDCSSVVCDAAHGTCNQETLACECDFGYSGDDCTIHEAGYTSLLSNSYN